MREIPYLGHVADPLARHSGGPVSRDAAEDLDAAVVDVPAAYNARQNGRLAASAGAKQTVSADQGRNKQVAATGLFSTRMMGNYVRSVRISTLLFFLLLFFFNRSSEVVLMTALLPLLITKI